MGRETELERLRLCLVADGRAAVSGLGGIGKTALAAEYAHRHRDAYPAGVFWLLAQEPAVLVADLFSLAWPLQLPEREERDQEKVIRAVIRWLQEHEDWLLVIDTLDERALPVVEQRLPPGLRGHVLATSRHPLWGATIPELEPLPLDLATRFLLDPSGQDDRETAELIAGRLGGLPLALEQAGAYLQETGESLAGYLQLLRDDLAGMLDQGRLDHDLEPVAQTWKVSFQRVQRASPAAAELLRLCSFYAPDDIPLSLLEGSRPYLDRRSRLRAGLSRRFEFNRAVGALLRYSLVRRQGELLSVHGLVQDDHGGSGRMASRVERGERAWISSQVSSSREVPRRSGARMATGGGMASSGEREPSIGRQRRQAVGRQAGAPGCGSGSPRVSWC